MTSLMRVATTASLVGLLNVALQGKNTISRSMDTEIIKKFFTLD